MKKLFLPLNVVLGLILLLALFNYFISFEFVYEPGKTVDLKPAVRTDNKINAQDKLNWKPVKNIFYPKKKKIIKKIKKSAFVRKKPENPDISISKLKLLGIYGTDKSKAAIIKNIVTGDVKAVLINDSIYDYKVFAIINNVVILKYGNKKYYLRIR